MLLADSFALLKTGNNNEASTPIMAITTNNSIRVNARMPKTPASFTFMGTGAMKTTVGLPRRFASRKQRQNLAAVMYRRFPMAGLLLIRAPDAVRSFFSSSPAGHPTFYPHGHGVVDQ